MGHSGNKAQRPLVKALLVPGLLLPRPLLSGPGAHPERCPETAAQGQPARYRSYNQSL